MSGIYIKGMEMPKNCYGCPFLLNMTIGTRTMRQTFYLIVKEQEKRHGIA